VGDRMRAYRWWLALAYALVTVLVQGVHDHGDEPADAGAVAGADCREPLAHVERARPSARPHGLEHCPACQYRANPHDAPTASVLGVQVHVGPAWAVSVSSAHPRPLVRATSRAPPPA
jgi:hypothetical protein